MFFDSETAGDRKAPFRPINQGESVTAAKNLVGTML